MDLRKFLGGRFLTGRPVFLATAALVLAASGVAYFYSRGKAIPARPVQASNDDGVAVAVGADTTRSNVAIHFEVSKNIEASNFGHKVVNASVTLKDSTTVEPLKGRRVLSWMSPEDDSNPIAEDVCKESIKSRLAGSLATQSGVNLNQWNLFTMNNDNTLSLINPQVSFSKTKLRQLVTLAGYPVDWALSRDGSKLFVSIPARGLVAVIDSLKGKVEKNISVGGKPVRVRSGAGTIIIGDDSGDEIHLVDDRTGDVVTSIDVGDGHKEITVSHDGSVALVASADDDEIVRVDLRGRREVSRSRVGEGISSVNMSSLGSSFAVNEREGRIYFDTDGKFDAKRYIDVGVGAAISAITDNGRWLFVANPKEGKVDIFNVATRALRYTVKGLANPDQIHMTDDFVYLRSAGKPGVALVRIDSLDRDGQPIVSEVQVGTLPPAKSADRGIALSMARSPEGAGMVLANPADKTIYFYQEGMMAPAGTIRNYGREPRGVIIADWSLRETSAGTYGTRAMLPIAGRYDAYVLLSEPRIGVCLKVDVPADLAMPGLAMETSREIQWSPSWNEKTRLKSGEQVTLRFDASIKEGKLVKKDLDPDALIVRSFVPPVGPAEDLKVRKQGDQFVVDLTPKHEGQLVLLIGSPSLGVDFTRRASVTVGVTATQPVARGQQNKEKSSL